MVSLCFFSQIDKFSYFQPFPGHVEIVILEFYWTICSYKTVVHVIVLLDLLVIIITILCVGLSQYWQRNLTVQAIMSIWPSVTGNRKFSTRNALHCY